MRMQTANGGAQEMGGCVEMLEIDVEGIKTWAHAYVVPNAPYRLLLGRPWQRLVCLSKNETRDEVSITISDPLDSTNTHTCKTSARPWPQPGLFIATSAAFFTLPSVSKLLSSNSRTITQSTLSTPYIPSSQLCATTFCDVVLGQSFELDPVHHVLAYKKVANKVEPVATTMPAHARIIRHFPEDPLASLPFLSRTPPAFIPGTCLTQERMDKLGVFKNKFLLPEERKLATHVLMNNEFALAWDETEKGRFCDDYFPPVIIPTIEHVPWTHRQPPIPPGIRDEQLNSVTVKDAASMPYVELLQNNAQVAVEEEWEAVNHFTNLADKSKEVLNLRNKSYNNFKLSWSDWRHLGLVHQVLKEPATTQQTFSSTKHPTAWQTIPTLECLADRWQEMANNIQYAPITNAIKQGLKNVNKYYKKTSDLDVYFICLVLDPNYKLAYVEEWWDSQNVADGRAHLETFDEYYKPPTRTPVDEPAPPTRPSLENQYGDAWMREAIKARQAADQLAHNPRQELTVYLSSPLEEANDVVAWWGLHSLEFPTLARIACNYLPIQSSSVPSKQAFSSGGITSTVQCNALASSTFGLLQLLKAVYRDGHVSATVEAEAV
ncbi:ribonuclease H-like domain-containing protein [Suillus tomentosus]|nr:ribonuclease H-like domain-containing protein [Suillus tomentosus]